MEDVIEAGEYVRTESGHIARLLEKTEYYYYFDDVVKESFGKQWILSSANNEIKKHSKQLIDLIEIGDIVNGMEVLDIHKPRDLWEPIEIKVDSRYTNFILAEDIKTILTKESYIANCYKVEGEK